MFALHADAAFLSEPGENMKKRLIKQKNENDIGNDILQSNRESDGNHRKITRESKFSVIKKHAI